MRQRRWHTKASLSQSRRSRRVAAETFPTARSTLVSSNRCVEHLHPHLKRSNNHLYCTLPCSCIASSSIFANNNMFWISCDPRSDYRKRVCTDSILYKNERGENQSMKEGGERRSGGAYLMETLRRHWTLETIRWSRYRLGSEKFEQKPVGGDDGVVLR